MYFLFLDTETTGLNPNNSQIIELAGIIAKFNPQKLSFDLVDSFESLISLRSEMDDKITRITGITSDELANARPIHQVQSDWANFLEKYEEINIVGHSIGFDEGFLKKESWYLPHKNQFVDTLDLSKICFPYLNAVNLEFLVGSLKLEPTKNQLSELGINDSVLAAHRAFYDTITCLNLFEKILLKFSEYGLDQKFYEKLCSDFFKTDVTFYTKDISKKENTIEPKTKQYINLDGKPYKENVYDKISKLGLLDYSNILLDLLSQNYPQEYSIILMQIYVINELKLTGFEGSMKIHTKNNHQIYMGELVLDHIITDNHNNTNPRENFLGPVESVIPNIRYISETSINFGKLIDFIEIYLDLQKTNVDFDKNILNLCSKIVSSYSFLLLGLQGLYQRGEYSYNHFELEPEEIVVNRKLTEFSSLIENIRQNPLPAKNDLTKDLVSSIRKQLEELYEDGKLIVSPKNKLTFRYFRNTLHINKRVYGFNLRNYFTKFVENNPGIKIETYLPPEKFNEFLELTNLNGVFIPTNIIYLNQDKETKEIISQEYQFIDLMKENIESGIENNSINLVLGGQNSTIRDGERVLTKNFKPSDFLLLGESGSLTKIISKMQNGFTGVVVVKIGDFGFISKHLGQLNITNIVVTNPPYFNINGYWFMISKNFGNENFMRDLKALYLDYQCGFIHYKSGKVVKYLRSYKV